MVELAGQNATKQQTFALVVLLVLTLAVTLSFARYDGGYVNYVNSDATWHTLLTMKAYDETPISVHHFVPIVSLGEATDKNIPWGATVPDKQGNYYYTSFTAPGFFLPFVFCKALGLQFDESSLYLFNSIIYIISAVLVALLVFRVFDKDPCASIVVLVGGIVYCTCPIVLQCMGQTYWHHSLMQVLLPLQLLLYRKYRRNADQLSGVVFVLLCIVTPYVEWTGFCGNVGFAIAELVTGRKRNLRLRIGMSCAIVFATSLGLSLIVAHYLSVIDWPMLTAAFQVRFFARSINDPFRQICNLIQGYGTSFMFALVGVLFFFALACVANKGLSWLRSSTLWKNKWLGIVLISMCAENLIMMGHAIKYPFDQMKFSFIIVFIICSCTSTVIQQMRVGQLLCVVCAIVVAISNFVYFKDFSIFEWSASYRQSNEHLAAYINGTYPSSVLCLEGVSVRGYANMLMGRGIYENRQADELFEKARESEAQYVVELHVDGGAWNMYKFVSATVYSVDGSLVAEVAANA